MRVRWSVLAARIGICVAAGVWWHTNEESIDHVDSEENEITTDALPAADVKEFDDVVGGVLFPEARSDIPIVELGTGEITVNGRTAWELQSFSEVVNKGDSRAEIQRLREEPIEPVVDDLRLFVETFYDQEERPETVELRLDGAAKTFWLDRVLASLRTAGFRFVSLHPPAWFDEVLPELTGFEDHEYFFGLSPWSQLHTPSKFVFGIPLPRGSDIRTKDWLVDIVNGRSVGVEDLDSPELLEGSQARDVLRSVWEKEEWSEWFPELEAHLSSEWDRDERGEEQDIFSGDWGSYELSSRADLPVWITLGVVVQYQAGLEYAYRERKPEYVISSPVWYRGSLIADRDIPPVTLERRIPTEEMDVEVRAHLMSVGAGVPDWWTY